MAVGLRSGGRAFTRLGDVMSALDLADAQATALARAALTSYLQNSPKVPRQTGRMAQTAVDHLLASGLTGALDLLIWFDTPYAGSVEDRRHFIEVIYPEVVQLVLDAIRTGYRNNGFEVRVSG